MRPAAITLSILFLLGLHICEFYFQTKSEKLGELLGTKQRDCESLLAIGDRVPLSSITPSDLLLIPGVSDILAFRIYRLNLSNQQQVLGNSEALIKDLLLSVKGIGPKTAERLLLHLDTTK